MIPGVAAGSRTYTIVGEDEADASSGRVSDVSPLAKVLLGAEISQTVTWRRLIGDLVLTLEQVESLSVGIQAVSKARTTPGDIALVTGHGTTELVTAKAAFASGCSQVVHADIRDERPTVAARIGAIPVNARTGHLADVVDDITDGWGEEVVSEASGDETALGGVFGPLCPGGTVVLVGMPPKPVPIDIVAAQAREARIETVFRYANTIREHWLC